MYINRILESKILKYLNKKEIIAIVGPRQCGKTTLIKHVFQNLDNAKFITFEDRDTLELFVTDIKAFSKIYVENTKYLFIDEFQYAKNGGQNLKYLYDIYNTKIIISGSSAPELTIHSIKYLVGRIFVFELFPLSFDEYLSFKDIKLFNLSKEEKVSEIVIQRINNLYYEFLMFGGYPRVVLSDSIDEKKEILKNIYNTYFLREIKEILEIQDDFKLSKFIRILALQIGGIANYNELCQASGFNYNELLKSLNLLKKTYICMESKPYFSNKKKEIIKAPKIFFIDNGFRNTVIDAFQNIDKRVDSGNLNENFVASELFKKNLELKYWRTKAGAEVDFIIEKEGELIPVQVKSLLKDDNITRSYRNFIEEYLPKKGFVLSYSFQKVRTVGNAKIRFIPLFNITNKIC